MQIEERRRKIREARKRLKEIKRDVVDPETGETYRKSFYGTTLEDAERNYRDFVNPPLQPSAEDVAEGARTYRENSVPWWYLNKLRPLKDHLRKNSRAAIQQAARHLLPELWDVMIWDLDAVALTQGLQRIAAKETVRNKNAKPKLVRLPNGEAAIVEPTPIVKRLSGYQVNKCRRLGLELNELAYEAMPDRVRRINPKRVPVAPEAERDVQVYTPPMMRVLLEGARGRTCFVPTILFGFLGLRINEGLGTNTDQLGVDGVLRITHQQDDDLQRTNLLKTRYSNRELPLPEEMVAELRPFSFARGTRLARGRDPEPKPGETKKRYGGPLMEGNVNRSLADVARRVGLPPVTAHELRHSFSTWLDESGCPKSVRLALLGHSKRAVEDRYNHASPAKMREWLGKLWAASLEEYDGPELRPEVADVGGTKSPARGEANGRAALTAAVVRDVVRPRLAKGETAYRIGKDLGVDPRAIRKIAKGETWRDVG